MIRYVRHREIDRGKWDHCMVHAGFETIYGRSWYLDHVSPGWDALVEGDYRAVMPLTWKKKLGLRYLIQPMLTQQLGVFTSEKLSGGSVDDFLDRIPRLFLYYNICLNSSNVLEKPFCHSELRPNYELDLNRDFASLKKSYSQNSLRNLKQAESNELEILNIKIEQYLELKKTVESGRSGRKHYNWLDSLFRTIDNHTGLEIRGIYSQGKLCAGAVWVQTESRLIYLNGIADETGRNSRAMFQIFDNTISRHHGKALVLDFEGSALAGVARFFKGFGAKEKNYLRIQGAWLPVSGVLKRSRKEDN